MDEDRIRLGRGVAIYRRFRKWWVEVNVRGSRRRASLKTDSKKDALVRIAPIVEHPEQLDQMIQQVLADQEARSADTPPINLPNTVLGQGIRELVRAELNDQKPKYPPLSIKDAVAMRMEVLEARGRAESHRTNVERQLKFFFDHAKVDFVGQVTPEHVTNYMAHVRSEGLGEKSVLEKYTQVNALMLLVKKRGFLGPNPCEDLKPDKPPQLVVRFFSAAEVRKILAAAAEVRIQKKDPDESDKDAKQRAVKEAAELAALCATAIYCGPRREELFLLEWKDVDLTERTIRVANREGKSTKTGVNRFPPILDQLLPFLHRLKRSEGRVFSRWNDLSSMGKIVQRLVARALDRDEDERADGLQTMRHTCATWLLAHDVAYKFVGQWLGNSPEILRKNYEGVIPHRATPLEMTFEGRKLLPTGLPPIPSNAKNRRG